MYVCYNMYVLSKKTDVQNKTSVFMEKRCSHTTRHRQRVYEHHLR